MAPISPDNFYARLGSALGPTVVDVRRDAPDPESGRVVVSGFYCAPEEVTRCEVLLTSSRSMHSLMILQHDR
jgi:hypothetical protein